MMMIKRIIISVPIAVFYIVFIIWNCKLLQKVKKDPQAFHHIPGYKEYRHSEWYFSTKKDIPADGLPYESTRYFLPHLIATAGCYTLSWYIFNWILYPGRDYIRLGYPFFGFSFYLFYALILWDYYIPMFMKHPAAICMTTNNICRGKKRSTAWKRVLKLIIISTIVFLPARILDINMGGYADPEKIVYSRLLSFHEKEYRYADVTQVIIVTNDDGYAVDYRLIWEDGWELQLYDSIFGGGERRGNYIREHARKYNPKLDVIKVEKTEE